MRPVVVAACACIARLLPLAAPRPAPADLPWPPELLLPRQDQPGYLNQTRGAATDEADPNLLLLNELNQTSFAHQLYVANGHLGARLPATGAGFQQILPANGSAQQDGGLGWPLFGPRTTTNMVAGFYAVNVTTIGTNVANPPPEREPAMATLPNWSNLYITLVGADNGDEADATLHPLVDASQLSNFTASLNIVDGIASTAYDWRPSPSSSSSSSSSSSPPPPSSSSSPPPVRVNYTVVAHRNRPTLAMVHLEVSGLLPGAEVVVTDLIDVDDANATASGRRLSVAYPLLPGANAEDRSVAVAARPAHRDRVESNDVRLNALAAVASALSLPDELQPRREDDAVPSALLASPALALAADNAKAAAAGDAAAAAAVATAAPAPARRSFTPGVSAQSWRLRVPADGTVRVWKAVGVATNALLGAEAGDEASLRATVALANETAHRARSDGWEALVEEHRVAWYDLWASGGEVEVHATRSPQSSSWRRNLKAGLYHLLANQRNSTEGAGLDANPIPPSGLSSDSYAGLDFWDFASFMYPPLSLFFPKYAEPGLNFRFALRDRFRRNAAENNASGLLMPWVTGVDGACSYIGPCIDYEYHLQNDVTLAMFQHYQQTRNRTYLEQQAFPFMRDVADFWASHVVYNATTGGYDHFNESSPDEFSNHKDNTAFTSAGISRLLTDVLEAADVLGIPRDQLPSNWSDIAANVTVPTTKTPDNRTITLEFPGFDPRVPVKQADVVLIEPLMGPGSREVDPMADLEFYAPLTSASGPAMTWGVFSVLASQVSERGCESHSRMEQSYRPYERFFGQFSEQQVDDFSIGGFDPAYTFLTGAGGFLQTFTHGFTGLRWQTDALYLDPSLPPQLAPEGFTLRGVRYADAVLDVYVGGEETVVTYRSGQGEVSMRVGKRNAKAGDYRLEGAGQTLKVPTTRVDRNPTLVPGNVAQCRIGVTSDATNTPGNLPAAAFDGSNSTYWQPANQSPASLTVDLEEPQRVRTVHLNLYSHPPASVALSVSNDSSPDAARFVEVMPPTPVTASEPYAGEEAAAAAAQVRLSQRNTSTYQLRDAVVARLVRVTVEGVVSQNGTAGGTVAEVAILPN